jgi:hypothetical protein
MHPTTARYLVDSHQSDLMAEAARERLARQAREATRQSRKPSRTVGFLAATRQFVSSILAIA